MVGERSKESRFRGSVLREDAYPSSTSEASSPYLGQTPPRESPKVFAEGIVSKGNVHGRLAISPDGKEMFWTTMELVSREPFARIMQVRMEDGAWTSPNVASFYMSGMLSGPLFSPDGRRLFFNQTEDVNQGWKTLYVQKTDSGWSMPAESKFPLKTSSSFTRFGEVYFSKALAGKPWISGIFSASYTENAYLDIRAMEPCINSPFIDYTPYISPEGDYLLFSSSRPSMDESMYLHIRFKNTDGTWSIPQRMNEKMGFEGRARFPSISPDGKYIFFCGDDGNIYWVSRDIIESYRPRSG